VFINFKPLILFNNLVVIIFLNLMRFQLILLLVSIDEAKTFDWNNWQDVANIVKNFDGLSYVLLIKHLLCINDSCFYTKRSWDFCAC